MSHKHVGAAGDLVRFGCSLRVELTRCAAAHTVTGGEVVRPWGSGDIETIRRRLECGRCGAKGARLIVLPPVA